ncbi:MAG: N-acetylmuramoyl-L-alanine amidase [Clostridium sp.]|uniref:N-acetylmuramoyl-L-alanine amidase n=1 Tax=Clostridium sp. TaxID=1506 RepID=UPI00306E141F
MKIGLRYGHSLNCRGAVGIIDEVDSCVILFNKVKLLLESRGHTIIDCNSNASSIDSELSEGTNKANLNNCDIYITIHLNAATNVNANGVECWVHDVNSSSAIAISNRICTNISNLKTSNRGIKYSKGVKDYHDLKASNMEAIIVETLFCTNNDDIAIFNNNVDAIAAAIANGIDPGIELTIKLEIDEMSFEGNQEVDNKITVYAHSTDPNVLYKYFYELNGSWTTITDWQESNNCSFMPKTPVTYKVVCHVKYRNNATDIEDAYNFITIDIKDKPSIYNMKVNGLYYGETYFKDIAAAVEKEMAAGAKEITLIRK